MLPIVITDDLGGGSGAARQNVPKPRVIHGILHNLSLFRNTEPLYCAP